MIIYDRNKPLISIHIPKCGGSSLRLVLKKWFKNKLLYHYFNEKHKKMPVKHNLKSFLVKSKYKKGICIHGHFNNSRGFGVKDYYPDVDQFITIIRDPFEMAVSNYFYGLKLGSNRFRNGYLSDYKSRYKDIEEYLNEHKSFMLLHFPFQLTLKNYQEIIQKHFIYIGIVDDLQTSIEVLSNRLNFPKISISHLNASERYEKIPKKIKQLFIKRNNLEYAIYNYVLKTYKS